MNEIRAAVNIEGSIRLYRNNCGTFKTEAGAYVKTGLSVGSADLVGIEVSSGRFVSIEVKTPTGKIDPQQLAWQKTIRDYNGVAEIVRSVSEALEVVRKIKSGEL